MPPKSHAALKTRERAVEESRAAKKAREKAEAEDAACSRGKRACVVASGCASASFPTLGPVCRRPRPAQLTVSVVFVSVVSEPRDPEQFRAERALLSIRHRRPAGVAACLLH